MRRSRALTSNDQLELAIFLAFLVVAGAIGATLVQRYSMPKLFAWGQTPLAHVQSKPISAVAEPPGLLAPVAEAAQAAPVIDVRTDDVDVEVIKPAPKARPEYKFYKGKKFQYVRTLRLRVTAYAPDPRCCWPYDGTTTASGLSVKTNGGKLVAADTRLIPMHSLVSVPGYHGGEAVPVLDRGGAIKGHRLDVLLPTFERAKQWGSQPLDVKVYMPVKD